MLMVNVCPCFACCAMDWLKDKCRRTGVAVTLVCLLPTIDQRLTVAFEGWQFQTAAREVKQS
jgi:hypothetical protein